MATTDGRRGRQLRAAAGARLDRPRPAPGRHQAPPADGGLRALGLEFLTGLGGPPAADRRHRAAAWVRLLVVLPALALPTLLGFLVALRTSARPEVIRPVFWGWCIAMLAYVVANVVTLLLGDRSSSARRTLCYLSLAIELSTNHLVTYAFGTLTSPALLNIVVTVAVYRVFFDFRLGLTAATLGAGLCVASGALELAGLIPVAPGMPYPIQHSAYSPDGWMILGTLSASVLVTFGAVNYGMNQALKLHRYITESVLRRYLPEALVRRAALGELRLDAPPDRRVVTVMFTDIVSFTPMSERLGPVALGELLNDYLTRMCAIAHRHQATIDKFVGDAIMIVFGAPEPLEPSEQARRCVRLAIEMQDAIATVSREYRLQARIGINTGDAVVGNFGSVVRSDYTVLGPAVNVAARLESRAQPGRILIGPETARLVRSEFELEPAGDLELKGVSGVVTAYYVGAPARA